VLDAGCGVCLRAFWCCFAKLARVSPAALPFPLLCCRALPCLPAWCYACALACTPPHTLHRAHHTRCPALTFVVFRCCSSAWYGCWNMDRCIKQCRHSRLAAAYGYVALFVPGKHLGARDMAVMTGLR